MRIGVPGIEIKLFSQIIHIDSVIKSAQRVVGNKLMGGVLSDDINLHIHEGYGGIRNETLIVQYLRSGNCQLILSGETNLIPGIIDLAPEMRTPFPVQGIQRYIAFF